MLKYVKLFSLIFLGFPLSAHSSLYTFEYEGYVAYLNGNGLGHYLGQPVNGVLTFDTTNSYGDEFPEIFETSYRAQSGVDFVNGYLPPSTDRNMDRVFVYDSIDADHIRHADGGIIIVDGLYSDASGSRNYGLEIDISFDDFDWLFNGKLNEFSFDGNDFVDANSCAGVFYEFNSYTKPDGTNMYDYNGATFRFSSAKLTLVDAPEPSALILMLCGGFMLYFARRFNVGVNLKNPNHHAA